MTMCLSSQKTTITKAACLQVAKDNHMTNLSDFLKVKKVRCVDGYGIVHLTEGKEYEIKSLDYISVYGDDGCSVCIDSNRFKPVLDSAENPLQNMELTPEFEAVEPKFKVGDKVYVGLTGKIRKIDSFNSNDGSITYSHNDITTYSKNKDVVKATQENYEMLCKLYPHIEFEQPTKPLTGSDLCRAMLDKGWKYVPCYVSNTSDKNAVELDDCGVIYTVNHNGNFQDGYGETWCHVVPFDPRTGEPLTEAVLGE